MKTRPKKSFTDEPYRHVHVWTRFLIFMGYRSFCCKAKITTEYHYGWPPRNTCTGCGKRLR